MKVKTQVRKNKTRYRVIPRINYQAVLKQIAKTKAWERKGS